MSSFRVLLSFLWVGAVFAATDPGAGRGRRRRELQSENESIQAARNLRRGSENVLDMSVDDFGRLLEVVPDDFCCDAPNSFKFLLRELDLDGKAVNQDPVLDGWLLIPGTDLSTGITECIYTFATDEEEIKCSEAVICREACPSTGFGSDDDFITEACRNECTSGDSACQAACTVKCEGRCESTYNDYVIDPTLYFEGIDILYCVRDGDASACTDSLAYWATEGYSCVTSPEFNCDCIDVCDLGPYDCTESGAHCPSAAPSASPSSAPSDRPSSKPSSSPSAAPSSSPSDRPSSKPSSSPSDRPSSKPSASPSKSPTESPTFFSSLVPDPNDNYATLGFDYESKWGGGCPEGNSVETWSIPAGDLDPQPLPAGCVIENRSIVVQCVQGKKVAVIASPFDVTVYLKGGGGGTIYNLEGNSQQYNLTVPGNGAVSQITFLFYC